MNNNVILAKKSIATYFGGAMFFVIGCLFLAMPWGLASNADQIALPYKLLITGIASIAALSGFGMIRYGHQKTVFERTTAQFIIDDPNSKTGPRRIDAKEVKEAFALVTKDSDGDSAYELGLKLKNTDVIRVPNSWTGSKDISQERIDYVNRLLKDPHYDRDKDPDLLMAQKSYEHKLSQNPHTVAPPGVKPKIPPQWRGILTAVVLLVVALPWVSWGVATLDKSTQTIEAGAPTAAVERMVQFEAASVTSQGEKILWVGTPEPGHENWQKIFFIPFFAIWTLFSILWTSLAFYGGWQTRSIAPYLMSLFGLPFVAVGLGVSMSPYFTYETDLHTIYVITDKQVVRIQNHKARSLVAYNDRDFGPIKLKPYSGERADLEFYTWDDEGRRSPLGFWGIKDGATAAKILESKLARK